MRVLSSYSIIRIITQGLLQLWYNQKSYTYIATKKKEEKELVKASEIRKVMNYEHMLIIFDKQWFVKASGWGWVACNGDIERKVKRAHRHTHTHTQNRNFNCIILSVVSLLV